MTFWLAQWENEERSLPFGLYPVSVAVLQLLSTVTTFFQRSELEKKKCYIIVTFVQESERGLFVCLFVFQFFVYLYS